MTTDKSSLRAKLEHRAGLGMAVETITGTQCKMARAALDMDIRELSERTGISTSTIWRFETGRKVNKATASALQFFFENNFIEFTLKEDGRRGVMIRV
jgi:DNA-binding transcriptional regulator YiaG